MGNVGVKEAAKWFMQNVAMVVVALAFVMIFTFAFVMLTGIADKYASKTAVRPAYIDPTNGQCYMKQGKSTIPCPVPAVSK